MAGVATRARSRSVGAVTAARCHGERNKAPRGVHSTPRRGSAYRVL